MDNRLVEFVAGHAWDEVIGTPWADAPEDQRAAWRVLVAAGIDVVALLRTRVMRWDGAKFVEVVE